MCFCPIICKVRTYLQTLKDLHRHLLQKYQNLNPDAEISLATSYEDKINLLNQYKKMIMPYGLNYYLIMQYTESIILNFVENENVELLLINPKKDPPILMIAHYKENKIILINPLKLKEKWLLSYEMKRIR
ncbi:MAG: hypothetical protein GXN99_01220 [Candidatus Nanohaloarchaeota archaeon]|nr:hypothetical protein [Candidatus Nanohaloarchaeota archaeon]